MWLAIVSGWVFVVSLLAFRWLRYDLARRIFGGLVTLSGLTVLSAAVMAGNQDRIFVRSMHETHPREALLVVACIFAGLLQAGFGFVLMRRGR